MNTETCPSCGKPNECTRAANDSASDCWCFKVQLTKEQLAAVQSKYPDAGCLCQKCLETAMNRDGQTDTP